jgi:hypothetical protein
MENLIWSSGGPRLAHVVPNDPQSRLNSILSNFGTRTRTAFAFSHPAKTIPILVELILVKDDRPEHLLVFMTGPASEQNGLVCSQILDLYYYDDVAWGRRAGKWRPGRHSHTVRIYVKFPSRILRAEGCYGPGGFAWPVPKLHNFPDFAGLGLSIFEDYLCQVSASGKEHAVAILDFDMQPAGTILSRLRLGRISITMLPRRPERNRHRFRNSDVVREKRTDK